MESTSTHKRIGAPARLRLVSLLPGPLAVSRSQEVWREPRAGTSRPFAHPSIDA